MIHELLGVILLVGVATLAVTIGTLRSSRRSEGLGEDRYELLRDQHDRLEMMREERRMLTEQLELESRERRHLTEYLEETDPRLMENLERRREARTGSEHETVRLEEERQRLEQERRRLGEELEQEHRKRLEVQQRTEQLEQEREELSRVQQEAERLRQERQRLAEDLERWREECVEMQSRAEQQELELARLEQELGQSQAELERRKRAPARAASGASNPWWRRPILVVGLLLGVFVAWFTSLAVALNMLAT